MEKDKVKGEFNLTLPNCEDHIGQWLGSHMSGYARYSYSNGASYEGLLKQYKFGGEEMLTLIKYYL